MASAIATASAAASAAASVLPQLETRLRLQRSAAGLAHEGAPLARHTWRCWTHHAQTCITAPAAARCRLLAAAALVAALDATIGSLCATDDGLETSGLLASSRMAICTGLSHPSLLLSVRRALLAPSRHARGGGHQLPGRRRRFPLAVASAPGGAAPLGTAPRARAAVGGAMAATTHEWRSSGHTRRRIGRRNGTARTVHQCRRLDDLLPRLCVSREEHCPLSGGVLPPPGHVEPTHPARPSQIEREGRRRRGGLYRRAPLRTQAAIDGGGGGAPAAAARRVRAQLLSRRCHAAARRRAVRAAREPAGQVDEGWR